MRLDLLNLTSILSSLVSRIFFDQLRQSIFKGLRCIVAHRFRSEIHGSDFDNDRNISTSFTGILICGTSTPPISTVVSSVPSRSYFCLSPKLLNTPLLEPAYTLVRHWHQKIHDIDDPDSADLDQCCRFSAVPYQSQFILLIHIHPIVSDQPMPTFD